MAPEARKRLAPPCSRSFWGKFTVLKKVLATMLGLFGARGIVPPCRPLLGTPLAGGYKGKAVLPNI